MDKNTLLAFILMAGVVLTYQSIFPPKHPKTIKNSQVIVNTIDTNNSISPSQNSAIIPSEARKLDYKEEKWAVSSTQFKAQVLNVGGMLHNVSINDSHLLPLENIVVIKGLETAQFNLVSQNDDETILAYADGAQQIRKIIQIVNPHVMKIRLEIKNGKEISNLKTPEFILFNINSSEIDSTVRRETMLDEYSIYSNRGIFRKNASKFSPKDDKALEGSLKWAAFRDRFNAFVIHPEFETKQYELKSVTDKSLVFSIEPKEALPAQKAIYEFTAFMGPQDTALMKKEGKDFEKVVAFSGIGVFNIVAMGLYHMLLGLHWIVRSWGLTIIAVALLVYLVTYPLTMKSMMSMRRMQQVQPKIKGLQERFKNDPQKLNAEIMEIYKREKINPMGGCLPLFLQILISYPAYQVLSRSFYFKGQSFLWIKDLSQPDRLFIFPFSLPFLGHEFNILPIVMGIVMFFQQKLASKTMVITDEQQAMQQKMMMYFIPVILVSTFYHFAGGISLYFICFYLLSTLTQWKMNKLNKQA